jgi:hypothetical protein
MAAFEEAVQALGVLEARVGVRASLPSNRRFYERLGYRALTSRPYPTGTDVDSTLSKSLEVYPGGQASGTAAQPSTAADGGPVVLRGVVAPSAVGGGAAPAAERQRSATCATPIPHRTTRRMI